MSLLRLLNWSRFLYWNRCQPLESTLNSQPPAIEESILFGIHSQPYQEHQNWIEKGTEFLHGHFVLNLFHKAELIEHSTPFPLRSFSHVLAQMANRRKIYISRRIEMTFISDIDLRHLSGLSSLISVMSNQRQSRHSKLTENQHNCYSYQISIACWFQLGGKTFRELTHILQKINAISLLT